MPDIGAQGVLGLALETVSGTYLAPTKFIPFESENLKVNHDVVWRRPIRNTPGLVGAVAGNIFIEGEVALEALSDVIPYFLHASRCSVVKTGTGPYTYTYTPSAIAVPAKTLSIAVRRSSTEVFGFVGCVVSSFTFNIEDNGIMKFKASIVGLDEASAAALAGITWPTTTPFGAGQYSMQIPTATQVFDADGFEFSADDSAEPQFRMKSSGRGASWVKFGESQATAKINRDFATRADFDGFKALTAQSLTFVASKGASESITILMPVAYKEDYEINIGGQGDAIRASVSYQCAIDGTGKHYQITVICAENIV